MAIEIVEFPIKHGIFHCKLLVHQRVIMASHHSFGTSFGAAMELLKCCYGPSIWIRLEARPSGRVEKIEALKTL